jgi:hypothetical protein
MKKRIIMIAVRFPSQGRNETKISLGESDKFPCIWCGDKSCSKPDDICQSCFERDAEQTPKDALR